MNKRTFFIPFLILAGISFLAAGCNQQAPAAPTPASSNGNTVTIANFSFSPQTLTVKAGTSVVWVNDDAAAHQIKSATFNSDLLNKGQNFSFTFNEKGSVDYSCAIHPSMLGKIIVE